MILLLFLYNLIFTLILGVGILPFYLYSLKNKRFREGFLERLGFYTPTLRLDQGSGKRIWVHAASLGEVWVARAIIEALLTLAPQLDIVLSTITSTGNRAAKDIFQGKVRVIYFPLDHPLCVRRALHQIQPRAFIGLETEIWPNFITQTRARKIPLLLAHGRISARSFRNYYRLKGLFAKLFSSFQIYSMIAEEGAERIQKLGADPSRIRVAGSAKLDGLFIRLEEEKKKISGTILLIPKDDLVWAAGSTRTGEEEIVLSVYQRLRKDFPGLILILAPRHLDRLEKVEELIKKQGLPYQLLSEIVSGKKERLNQIILVDTMGDLFGLYQWASVVFCGASLVPKGGQNPLEPAIWGKPVLYGPHMEDFKEATALLQDLQMGFMVHNEMELYTRIKDFLSHPQVMRSMEEKGNEMSNFRGAAVAHAQNIYEVLGQKGVL